MNKISLIIALVLLSVITAIAVGGWMATGKVDGNSPVAAGAPVAVETPGSQDVSGPEKTDVLVPANVAVTAPALAEGRWINSEPMDLESLRGNVVYLEFWTFGCYNCVNTLPTVKRFHADYAGKGLTVIGIETPELEFERSFVALEAAVKKRGIEYPVLTDYENRSWEAYSVWAWPTIVIIDRQGRIRYRHIGEGAYSQQESVIRTLLAE